MCSGSRDREKEIAENERAKQGGDDQSPSSEIPVFHFVTPFARPAEKSVLALLRRSLGS